MIAKSIIIIYGMKAYNASPAFGRGDIVTVIKDARDIGVQLYANDSGSMYFTLPVDHPAVPLISPLSQHYLVQRLDNGVYVDVQGGIITDYDSSANEVVINGVDYMTVLNKYYTPLHGPRLGEKAIPNLDTTVISPTSPADTLTPKSTISAAVTQNQLRADQSYQLPVSDASNGKEDVGGIHVYSGSARTSGAGPTPSGDRDSITVEY